MKLLNTLISEIDNEQAPPGQTDLGQLRSPKDTSDEQAPASDGKRKFIVTIKDNKGEHVKKKAKAHSIADIKAYYGQAFVSAQLHDDKDRDADLADIDKGDAAPVADDEEPDKAMGSNTGGAQGGGEVGGVDEGMALVELMLIQEAKAKHDFMMFPKFDTWAMQKNLIDDGDEYDLIDGAYVQDTDEDVVFRDIQHLVKKDDVKAAKDKIIKAVERLAKFCVTGRGPQAKKLKDAAPKYAEEMYRHLAAHWKSFTELNEGLKVGKSFKYGKARITPGHGKGPVKEELLSEMAKRVAPAKFWDMAVDAEGVEGAQNMTWAQIKAVADKNDVLIPVYIRDNKIARGRWTAKPKDMAAPAHHPKVEGGKAPQKKPAAGAEVVVHLPKPKEEKPKAEEPKKEAPAPEKKSEYDKSDFQDVHFIHSASYLSTRELYAEIKKLHGVEPNDTERLPVGKARIGPHGIRLGTSYIVKKGTHEVLGYWDVLSGGQEPGRGFVTHGRGGVAMTKKGKKEFDEARSYGFLMRPEHGTPYISVGTQHSYGPWTKFEADAYVRDKYEHHEYDDEFGHGTIQVVKVKKVGDKWERA